MSKSIDWATVSHGPNIPAARTAMGAWLKSAQRVHTDTDLLGHIESMVASRRVLAIGVPEHRLLYVHRPDWRRGRICIATAHFLHINILAPLMEELSSRGSTCAASTRPRTPISANTSTSHGARQP